MTTRPNRLTVLAVACVVAATLFACKKKKKSRLERSSAPASASSVVSKTATARKPRQRLPELKIDASRVSDRQLCKKPRQPSDAITNQPPEQIMAAMRGALRSVRANEVYGALIMEFPSIETWLFKVQASRESGLAYVAQSAKSETDQIRIVQLPSGAVYARGKVLFSSEPKLESKVSDQWFEVPDALLKVSPGDAQPNGPQGPFGLNIGHRAVIAAFVQEAISWYPDQQADWLFDGSSRDKACVSSVGCPGKSVQTRSKEISAVDKSHRFFAGCQSILVNSGGVDLQLSASDKPLPLQYEPQRGTITGRFRWGHYNQVIPRQTAPPGAVSLASLQ